MTSRPAARGARGLIVRGCASLTVLALVAAALLLPAPAAQAGTLPTGFNESAAFSGLTEPTSLAFSPDGRVFVAEKSGVIKVFDGLSDTTPTTFADLSEEVYNFWDRGLLGMALDPDFPAQPYVYVLYTRDAKPGGQTPFWGGTSASDPCPTPPGPTDDGCVVTGRLSKLTASGNSISAEQPLITDWCQQFPSHSIGDLAFDSHGALYVSGGEGANFLSADWGQYGSPVNPCGDPPGGVGAGLTPPNAEGGSLRSQDVRTLGNPSDPTGLSGALLRIHPDTGQGWAGNPYAGSGDANAERILAYGFRNPFRIAVDPTNDQVWLGDVGQSGWEEIDHVDPLGSGPRNFGWPCYEGPARQGSWDAANLDLCESLYSAGAGAVAAPVFSYDHGLPLVPGEACGSNGASTSGLAFYEEGPFPDAYDGALFFADYTRDCIWSMKRGIDGQPDPSTIKTFDLGAASPVNLKVGPDGGLYFADLNDGKISRITYTAGNRPPAAVAKATPSNGPAPLQVQLSASESTDPDPGDTLTYAWDLDEDGQFDDSTAISPSHTFSSSGPHVASVQVTDNHGAATTAAVTIQVGNSAPVATIDSPASTLTWAVGDEISFSASATDAQEALPPSAYAWTIVIHHCSAASPNDCHTHTVESVVGQTGSFIAPDHEYPSYLEFRLKVTDAGGLTDTESVRVDPQTVALSIQSLPRDGFQISVGDETKPTPFSVQVIKGSRQSISAPGQSLAGTSYDFGTWSDGGAASHDVTVDGDLGLTAVFVPPPAGVDSIAPAAPTISSTSPASPANANVPTLHGIAESGATVRLYPTGDCSGPALASVPSAQFAIGVPLAVADDSTTAFAATATDAAGNTSACSSAFAYVEDSTAPETAITRAPRLHIEVPAANRRGRVPVVRTGFSFGSNDPTARFLCRIDAATPIACTSPLSRIKLKLGTHRLSVRAVDPAGNVDPTPAFRRVSVEEAPVTASRKRTLALLLRPGF